MHVRILGGKRQRNFARAVCATAVEDQNSDRPTELLGKQGQDASPDVLLFIQDWHCHQDPVINRKHKHPPVTNCLLRKY
jgi:hypothetical protein